MKATELKDRSPVDEIVLKITDVKEPTQTRVGMVQQAEGEDDSGSATITLWNDQVGQFEVGQTVRITKGWCKAYQGQFQVSSGKFGTLEKVDPDDLDSDKE